MKKSPCKKTNSKDNDQPKKGNKRRNMPNTEQKGRKSADRESKDDSYLGLGGGFVKHVRKKAFGRTMSFTQDVNFDLITKGQRVRELRSGKKRRGGRRGGLLSKPKPATVPMKGQRRDMKRGQVSDFRRKKMAPPPTPPKKNPPPTPPSLLKKTYPPPPVPTKFRKPVSKVAPKSFTPLRNYRQYPRPREKIPVEEEVEEKDEDDDAPLVGFSDMELQMFASFDGIPDSVRRRKKKKKKEEKKTINLPTIDEKQIKKAQMIAEKLEEAEKKLKMAKNNATPDENEKEKVRKKRFLKGRVLKDPDLFKKEADNNSEESTKKAIPEFQKPKRPTINRTDVSKRFKWISSEPEEDAMVEQLAAFRTKTPKRPKKPPKSPPPNKPEMTPKKKENVKYVKQKKKAAYSENVDRRGKKKRIYVPQVKKSIVEKVYDAIAKKGKVNKKKRRSSW